MTKKFFHRSENQQDKPLVLIAGGAGFIGSFLCELLLNENCRVVCLDNLQTGSKRNLTNCSDNENFHFLKQDITQPLKKVFENPAYIFHLAGLEAYFNQKNHSLESLLVNVAGTINLLQLAKETGAKFLLGSNQKIFQAKISTQQLIDYFGEGAPGELASFSEAKRSAEAITTEYVERYDIDARVVRFDWVYGPRMNLNTAGIISQIINQGVEGKPLKIPGDGSEKIRPIFVSDVVSGLFKAMFGSGTTGKIFNLTGPDEVSLFSLAQTLQELISTDLKIEYISQKEAIGLTTDSAVSGKGELNWHPHVGLKEGLKQTLAFFKKSLPKKKKGEKSKPTGLKIS